MIDNEILRSGECEELLPELSAYIDGELDGDAVIGIKEHLEKCEKCRALILELSRLSGDIGAASIPCPDDLHVRIMDSLNEEIGRGRRKNRVLDFGKAMKKHGMWIGAGVAAVICLVLVGSPVFNGSFSFGMDDAKDFAAEGYADMSQNGGLDIALEMSKSNTKNEIYYSAEEAEMENYSLTDDVEAPGKEDAEDMTAFDGGTETETNERSKASPEKEYKLIPSFMLPRGELGKRKTELPH